MSADYAAPEIIKPEIVLTHSDIQNFLECRRTFDYSVVRDRVPPEKPVGPLALGTRVHKAIERYHVEGIPPLTAYQEIAAAERLLVDPDQWAAFDEDNLLGMNCMSTYWDWVLTADPYRDYDVEGVESVVRVRLEFPDVIVILQGKVDIVLRHKFTGGLMVEDWKGLALDTPIPTPDGWTTMRDLRPGDTVFGGDGASCQVVGKSATKNKMTYRVTFDDGTSVVCDDEHIWYAYDAQERNRARRYRRAPEPRPVGIQEIRRRLTQYGQKHWSVPITPGLDLPTRGLPIDPYLLGAWLGDGTRSGGTITKDDALWDVLESDGHELGPRQGEKNGCSTRTVYGLRTALRENDLLGHLFIPDDYLRASTAQRLSLLRGIMDTDGYWNVARNRAVFSSVRKDFSFQVMELLFSLGFKPRWNEVSRTGFGKTVTAYEIEFTAHPHNPFRAPVKADKVVLKSSQKVFAERRIIVAVDEVAVSPTACIAVDSPDSTYLCGDAMVVTHNTSNPQRLNTAMNYFPRSYQHHVYSKCLQEGSGEEVHFSRYVVLKKVKMLSRTTDPITVVDVPGFKKTHAQATKQLDVILQEIARAIRTPGMLYPSPGAECAWCAYRNPCLLAQEDSWAVDSMLDAEFLGGARLNRYGKETTA